MPNLRKYLTTVFLLLTVFACSNSWVSVYEGSHHIAAKIKIALDNSHIPVKIESSGNAIAVKVPGRNLQQSQALIDSLLIILHDTCKKGNILEEYFVPFIPDLTKKSTRELVRSSWYALSRHEDIFHVSCDTVHSQSHFPARMVIWYDSLSSQKDHVEELVKQELSSIGVSGAIQHDVRDIRSLIHSEVLQSADSSSEYRLIVLEPFSFRVPDHDKVSAGVQIMIVFFLFLSSGGVLGYWFAKRG
jgi:hypothetical protein